jgi:hypothetical protein
MCRPPTPPPGVTTTALSCYRISQFFTVYFSLSDYGPWQKKTYAAERFHYGVYARRGTMSVIGMLHQPPFAKATIL